MQKLVKDMKSTEHYCDDCGGSGDISSCCDAELDGNRCMSCNRFCSIDVCLACQGAGSLTYSVGDNVDIFVCAYSSDKLKKQLYNAKKVGDSKTFSGKITKILDKGWSLKVKVKRKPKEVKVELSDVELV